MRIVPSASADSIVKQQELVPQMLNPLTPFVELCYGRPQAFAYTSSRLFPCGRSDWRVSGTSSQRGVRLLLGLARSKRPCCSWGNPDFADARRQWSGRIAANDGGSPDAARMLCPSVSGCSLAADRVWHRTCRPGHSGHRVLVGGFSGGCGQWQRRGREFG